MQEVLDDLVWNDVPNIVGIGELGEGHTGNLGLLQVCKRWAPAVACVTDTHAVNH